MLARIQSAQGWASPRAKPWCGSTAAYAWSMGFRGERSRPEWWGRRPNVLRVIDRRYGLLAHESSMPEVRQSRGLHRGRHASPCQDCVYYTHILRTAGNPNPVPCITEYDLYDRKGCSKEVFGSRVPPCRPKQPGVKERASLGRRPAAVSNLCHPKAVSEGVIPPA